MSVGHMECVSDRDFKRISDVVHQHCGINLHDGKQELVQARLTKLLRHSQYDSLTDYLDHVLGNQDGDDFSISLTP